ncbi:AraC family transcriptional regulator [Bacillus subtilis]|uniref:helix-turn-helix transcriptional regulator n=1 Tax=Bacillus subtilis TaxID=1423 RepID=UPI001009E7D9|nr:AraC family transcriptional regulator [Bacillus subtilis]QAW15156.1 AraC family transcriptional regulator [Bacillus subtilis]QAW19267.1 AraC family transcriptional regulator [Bacillus subtilis]CAF1833606.1 Transposon Tn10 TetD protein [Bacillus subtilis]CAF1907958.1 Transposon Tn10 TetD protein [Bacillus subtilis]CAF1908780.1 Transposon Tn10 TetD protein [Bacillus subtilis]
MYYEKAVQKTINWIESHLHEQISNEDIVNVSSFSKFHFHRIFQKEVGMSVASYIRLRRLANAAAALLYTDHRIIDIALYYQFESQEAFTRTFKKMYHMPPGAYRTFMKRFTSKKEESYMEKKMKGWVLSGSHPFQFEMGIDRENVHQGKASGYLKSTMVQDIGEFATMMQQFKADRYLGKRLRLSSFIKTKGVQHFASLWMRVDSAADDVLQFDNMSNRPITGTTNWNHYAIVLDVPENSAVISFGVQLSGPGQVWMDHVVFEEVDQSVPSTNLEMPGELLDEPVNLSFEEELQK